MLKITKAKAKQLYEKGKDIYLIPSKIRLGAMGYPIKVNIATTQTTFDKCINSFFYYNCNTETGKVVHYYIQDK